MFVLCGVFLFSARFCALAEVTWASLRSFSSFFFWQLKRCAERPLLERGALPQKGQPGGGDFCTDPSSLWERAEDLFACVLDLIKKLSLRVLVMSSAI
jgi:hypothetical protein